MSRAVARHRAGAHARRTEPRRARGPRRRSASEPPEVLLLRRQEPEFLEAEAPPAKIMLIASALAPSLVMTPDALHDEGFDFCGWDWCDHYHASIEGSAPDLLPAHLVLDGESRVYIQGNADEFRKLCKRILAALPTTTGLALLADVQPQRTDVTPPPALRLVR